MDRFEARELVAEKLDSLGLLIRVEDYENNVGFSERADVPIEPRISMQWFLKNEPGGPVTSADTPEATTACRLNRTPA